MSFLTPAELRSLALTLALLAAGAGIRLWQGAQVRLGPFVETAVPGDSSRAPDNASPDLPRTAPDSAPDGAPHVEEGHPRHDPPAAAPPDPHPTTAPPATGSDPRLVHASLPMTQPIPPAPAARSRSRPAGNAPRKTSDVKVPLNQAGLAELAQVPGIGEKTAQAILAYRKANGPFLDLRELLNVKGIGEKKLERMAPCLILSPIREEDAPRQARLPP